MEATIRNIATAADRVKACESNCDALRERLSQTVKKKLEAEQKHAAVCDSFDAAAATYLDDPSDKNAKAVQVARDRRELSDLEINRARRLADEAERDCTAAAEAKDQACAELKRAQEAEAVEMLRQKSSIARFQEVSVPIWSRALRAQAELETALKELVSEYLASNTAASELRLKGIPAEFLEPHQLVFGVCMQVAQRDPGLVEGMIRGLQSAEALIPSTRELNEDVDLPDSLLKILFWGLPQYCEQFRSVCTASTLADLKDVFANTILAYQERQRSRTADRVGTAIKATR